jgi:hypothetical protein
VEVAISRFILVWPDFEITKPAYVTDRITMIVIQLVALLFDPLWVGHD